MLGVPIMSQHIYHELTVLVMCFHCLNSLKVQGRSELGHFSMFLIRGVLAIFFSICIRKQKKEYIEKKVFPSCTFSFLRDLASSHDAKRKNIFGCLA